MGRSRADKYKQLKLQITEDKGERIDSRRIRMADGTIVPSRAELAVSRPQPEPEPLVMDLGADAQPKRKRTTKVTQEQPKPKPKSVIQIERGGMRINAEFDMVADADEVIVVRGSIPLPVEPVLSPDEPEGTRYAVTVNGNTYVCLYLGISYSETPDTKTVVFHKT